MSHDGVPFVDILTRLKDGLTLCQALGLGTIALKGRFGEYLRRIEKLTGDIHEGKLDRLPPDRLEEYQREIVPYRVAYTESIEFGELVGYLSLCDPAVIRPKLHEVLLGPPLPSDESPSSNQARNIQFELALAAMMHRAGLDVELGEHPDVTVHLGPKTFHVECKRIFSAQKLPTRIREAGAQLKRQLKDIWPFANGIVAVSLSHVLNPEDVAPRIAAPDVGKRLMERWLKDVSRRSARDYGRLFASGTAVAILFHAASDFENLEANRFDRGRFCLGESYIPPFSSYGPALRELQLALESVAH